MKLKSFAAAFPIILLSALVTLGADRALIVGIEHYQDETKCNSYMSNLEEGCITPTFGGIADVDGIERLVQAKFGFDRSAIRSLKGSQATAANIRDSFKDWLINGTNPGDRVFFFYSGHGARVPDDNGDEADGMDEVIAPFDVQTLPSLTNFIRDDEVNQWIAALSGRQVVMVFDSCNSGTISRSLNSKTAKFSKYLITENVPKGRGFTDIFSNVPKRPESRDLSTVVDKYMSDITPNVVVISASQPYQEAMWLDTGGGICNQETSNPKYRGALAYLFEKIYSSGNPTLSQLDRELKDEMLALGKDGTRQLCPAETGYQIPMTEFNPTMAQNTIWGNNSATEQRPNWQQSPVTALHNPLSKIKVELNFTSPGNSYHIDDPINYSVTLGETCYLYVVVFSENNQASLIFPYSDNKNNFRSAGTYNFDAVAGEPLGTDVWVVIASKQRLPGLENLPDNEAFTWNEIYQKIGIKDVQAKMQEIARSRGVQTPGVRLNNTDWQTASAFMTTLAKR